MEFRVQAALHNRKVKPKPTPLKLSKEKRDEANDLALKMHARMQAEFEIAQMKARNKG